MSGDLSGLAGPDDLHRRIVSAGWLQGSMFRRTDGNPIIPGNQPYNQDEELLLVTTQSCTVLSPNFEKDPWVEVAIVRPLRDYNPNSQAARGELVREFHLPLHFTHATFTGIACNINRRFTFERAALATLSPLRDFVLGERSIRSLAAWIGRYYMRIALPDELVRRAKSTLFADIKKVFRAKGPWEGALHEHVIHVYINWAPNTELGSPDVPYEVNLLFLCEEPEVAEHLDRVLVPILDAYTPEKGLVIKAIPQVAGETYVSELNPYVRLSEWDYLSNLGELGDNPLGF